MRLDNNMQTNCATIGFIYTVLVLLEIFINLYHLGQNMRGYLVSAYRGAFFFFPFGSGMTLLVS